jgi:hypothetical protein
VGELCKNPQCDTDPDSIFAFVCDWSSGEDCPFFILDGMAKATDNTGRHAAKTGHTKAIPLTTNYSVARYNIVALCNKCGGTHDMAVSVILKDGPIEKQSIGDFYDGKSLPKNLADLTSRSISCPKTGRQSIQKENHQIFLVPAKN